MNPLKKNKPPVLAHPGPPIVVTLVITADRNIHTRYTIPREDVISMLREAAASLEHENEVHEGH